MTQRKGILLAGGSGTRLWPLSRAGFPKQFLVLLGSASRFHPAVDRVSALAVNDIQVGETLVVTHEEHRFGAYQLRDPKGVVATLLLEPMTRITTYYVPEVLV